jgi:hypothetical protein
MKSLNDPHEALVLVPLHLLEEIRETLLFLKCQADDKVSKHKLTEWISEKDAMELLGKKVTWFWTRRKSGELPFTKVGGKVFYAMADLNQYLERNRRSAA